MRALLTLVDRCGVLRERDEATEALNAIDFDQWHSVNSLHTWASASAAATADAADEVRAATGQRSVGGQSRRKWQCITPAHWSDSQQTACSSA